MEERKYHTPPAVRPQTGKAGDGEEIEIDLVDLFRYLGGKIVYLLLALVIGMAAAGAYTFFCIEPTYEASSYLYMVSASSGSVVDLSDLNIGTSVASDYEQLLCRRPVLDNVVTNLSDEIVVGDDLWKEKESGAASETATLSEKDMEGKLVVDAVTDLAKKIDVTTVSDSRVLKITVTTTNPVISRDIANEIAEQAVDYIPKIMNVTAPTIAEYAVTPKEKAAPSNSRNMILGGLVCLLIVAAVFTVRYVTDDTIQDADDLEKIFGMVPLAVIPEGDMAPEETKKGSRLSRKKRGHSAKH